MHLLTRDTFPTRRAPIITVPVSGVSGLGCRVWGVGTIWSTIESWGTGYDSEELQRQSAELDAKLAELNEQARDRGQIDQDTYEATVQHLANQIRATEEIPEQINEAWVEGAIEGYHDELAVLESIPEYAGKITGDVLGAVTRGVTAGVGNIGKGFLGNLPWWVWVGGAAALFFYFGGGQVLRYQAEKRIRKYSHD